MSVSKFGYLLKEEYEYDLRLQEAEEALRQGNKDKYDFIMKGIKLSWGAAHNNDNFISLRK